MKIPKSDFLLVYDDLLVICLLYEIRTWRAKLVLHEIERQNAHLHVQLSDEGRKVVVLEMFG